MWYKHKQESGFTLIEIVVILAVIAIIAAAMLPRITGIMDDAKVSRATSEVQNIGMSILRFNANTGRWPARSATGTDNYAVTLVSGSSSAPVNLPTYSGGGTNYFNSTPQDYFDNHLKNNTPGGTGSYTTTGTNRWNGPYLQQVAADPWGNAYTCNVIGAYSTSYTGDLYCYVISAGPDGVIQTDANVSASEKDTHAVSGDDIAFLLRARR